MSTLSYSIDAEKAILLAINLAKEARHEYITPDHLMVGLCQLENFGTAFERCAAMCHDQFSIQDLRSFYEENLDGMDTLPSDEKEVDPIITQQLQDVLLKAQSHAYFTGATEIDVPDLLYGILDLSESWTAFYLLDHVEGRKDELVRSVAQEYGRDERTTAPASAPSARRAGDSNASSRRTDDSWRSHVTCINDHLADHNPLIGREAELDRTIQVLCRKEKNNPIHLGEPGVGKTSIVYGLAQRIADGNVPDSLKDARIYQLDLGNLLAGTQFRGDFEARLKSVLEGVATEPHALLYIDEIHNIVGAGQTGEGSMDASNMLKPYLEGGTVRFIGATTYDEYNRHLSRSKGMLRRFQPIDIDEPSIDDTLGILRALQPIYEAFHHVTYTPEAIDMAVRGSAKHITDRYLPDKAIDIIDEAGAYLQMHPTPEMVVDHTLVATVLARISKVDALAIKESDNERLDTLESRLGKQVFGQDDAIHHVVEAVQMAKAGLNDEGKPLASLLFVGPTGVGKTEVARVLAKELGVSLVRFDMSEYMEKHTVAKLIGSPAGYVGYEDGGQLTDAIRRSPDCVLLLDEIEKAHDDIYNVLLQVMDYGVLTDNKGRKAHFQNVVVIMTSNAGAQFASQASVGFASRVTAGDAMLAQVKKTFKPEFINRLSGIVVFNDMTQAMAALVLDKKLRQLEAKLAARGVTITLEPAARDWLVAKGYSKRYGAREMDRVINQHLKSPLMRAILFGNLKQGGHATVTLNGEKLEIKD